MMKRERREPTRAELGQMVSRKPIVVRKIRKKAEENKERRRTQ
jgi:hypothetical protein